MEYESLSSAGGLGKHNPNLTIGLAVFTVIDMEIVNQLQSWAKLLSGFGGSSTSQNF